MKMVNTPEFTASNHDRDLPDTDLPIDPPNRTLRPKGKEKGAQALGPSGISSAVRGHCINLKTLQGFIFVSNVFYSEGNVGLGRGGTRATTQDL